MTASFSKLMAAYHHIHHLKRQYPMEIPVLNDFIGFHDEEG